MKILLAVSLLFTSSLAMADMQKYDPNSSQVQDELRQNQIKIQQQRDAQHEMDRQQYEPNERSTEWQKQEDDKIQKERNQYNN